MTDDDASLCHKAKDHVEILSEFSAWCLPSRKTNSYSLLRLAFGTSLGDQPLVTLMFMPSSFAIRLVRSIPLTLSFPSHPQSMISTLAVSNIEDKINVLKPKAPTPKMLRGERNWQLRRKAQHLTTPWHLQLTYCATSTHLQIDSSFLIRVKLVTASNIQAHHLFLNSARLFQKSFVFRQIQLRGDRCFSKCKAQSVCASIRRSVHCTVLGISGFTLLSSPPWAGRWNSPYPLKRVTSIGVPLPPIHSLEPSMKH